MGTTNSAHGPSAPPSNPVRPTATLWILVKDPSRNERHGRKPSGTACIYSFAVYALKRKTIHPALLWVGIESAVSITTRSSLDGHDLTVDPFGNSVRDSRHTVGHNVVPSRIPEELMTALAFHLSAPHSSALARHCRNKKTDWQKK